MKQAIDYTVQGNFINLSGLKKVKVEKDAIKRYSTGTIFLTKQF